MDLTTALIDNLLQLTDGGDNHSVYWIKFRLAVTYQQADHLTKRFSLSYPTLTEARNWGTGQKFNIVIVSAQFSVDSDNEDEFNRFLSNIYKTPYPTENNFYYYLDRDYSPA